MINSDPLLSFPYPRRMFDHDWLDPSALSTWRQRPLEALKCYLVAGALSLYPHEYNANTRKIVTIIVFIGWLVFEGLHAMDVATSTGLFPYFRYLVLFVWAQMWGIELANMQAFGVGEFTSSQQPDERDTED
jgi:hypothetical protein